jgi:hypothetical protein
MDAVIKKISFVLRTLFYPTGTAREIKTVNPDPRLLVNRRLAFSFENFKYESDYIHGKWIRYSFLFHFQSYKVGEVFCLAERRHRYSEYYKRMPINLENFSEYDFLKAFSSSIIFPYEARWSFDLTEV